MTAENKTEAKKVLKPASLKSHRKARAEKILAYAAQCVAVGEKIDKAFIKELGEIA